MTAFNTDIQLSEQSLGAN